MSTRKYGCIRVYSFGNSYVLSSDNIKDEKLQIRMSNNTVCINSLTSEEWNSLVDSKTNSVSSPSHATLFTSIGCLGLLSTSVDLSEPMQQFQQTQYMPVTQVPNQKKNESATMQHFLLFVKEASSVGQIRSFEVMRISDIYVLSLNGDVNTYNQQMNYQNQLSEYINDIKKLLCSGVFYYSLSSDPNLSFDLTLSSQARNSTCTTNKKFLWNYNMHIPLRRLNVDTNAWLLKIICGYVEIRKVLSYSKSYRVAIISRMSCERVGARFHCRGINDHGNCANFVETEQIIYSTDTDEEVSFLQLRGSVPVFFEQTGIQVGSHRIKIARSIQACYPAFERHIQSLLGEYGRIYVLNLLGTKGDEAALTEFYRNLCEQSKFSMKEELFYTNFDYHQEIKLNKSSLYYKLWADLYDQFYKKNLSDGVFFYSKTSQASNNNRLISDNDSGFVSDSSSIFKPQIKFIRTNCMDCLDRTNSVQSFIGREMLQFQLKGLIDLDIDLKKFIDVFSQMWVSNGDNISRIYAGTGAIQGRSVTKDITTSLSRAFQNNFLDDNKHDSIESFLYSMSRNYGSLNDRVSVLMSKMFLRLPYTVLKEIVNCKHDYTEKEKCRIMVGTWNINGGFSDYDMRSISLNDWLIDGPLNARKCGLGYLDPSVHSDVSNLGNIDIFCIGFEEIVDLNAQNIVKASEDNATVWRKKINEFLKQHGDYVELINENLQLVGVCIFVFVLKKHVGAIRDVSVAKTKTGFGGTAGNKGAVLLRFIYYNTSMCFVCSHFAAHQKEIKQRNDDFRQIYEQSSFSGQKTNSKSKIMTKNHDYIFWLGDLNYRIDLPNDLCRKLISERNWNPLLDTDQLTVQRNEQNVFREFCEAPISFPPTYKYNVGEDTYDRSEKCRVPAWTDRILWRKRNYSKDKEPDQCKCLYYGRADIRYSDHRPVSCLLEVDVNKVIPKRLIEVLNKVLLSCHGSFQVVLVVSTHTNEMNDLIKEKLVNMFMTVPTFAAVRQYKNNLYVTYSDGKYAYEAFGQFNNFHIESYDLTVQIRVENEEKYLKVIEEELMDCLQSLDYYKNNIRKMSVLPTEVIDLLTHENKNENSDGDDNSLISYINVPSQLHSNISITNNMQNLRSSDLDSLNLDQRHDYHNPMIKALSNSNLTSLHHTQNTRYVHSVANLLDLSQDDSPSSFGSNLTINVPPQRPPPPPPSQTKIQKEQPLIEILTDSDTNLSNEFGFDDDFSKLDINEIKPPIVPSRPPPLPPLPNQNWNLNEKNTSSGNNSSKAIFSLFDDSFEPVTPVQSQLLKSEPPLPPYPSRPGTLSTDSRQTTQSNYQTNPQTLPQSLPPPLPPLPSKPIVNKQTQNISVYMSELASVLNNNSTNSSNVNNNKSTVPPPLPPPPKLPPRPINNLSNQSKIIMTDNSFNNNIQASSNTDLFFSDNFSSNSQTNLNANKKFNNLTTSTNQQANFDPFGDSFSPNE